ncbi:MAG: hypothetical protein SAK29_41945, partial [Scytonema sp. PMC 1069.18]|nr:hypothetical protein [Scytonema sp. PMC 1069.18]MEC4886301.1 hypothetical protein [Scytonema sp. PMC 1070.18]
NTCYWRYRKVYFLAVFSIADLGAEVVISIVTVQELFNGWVVRINGTQKVEDVVRLYGKLNRTVALFGRVKVLDFDEKAGETFQRLQARTSEVI